MIISLAIFNAKSVREIATGPRPRMKDLSGMLPHVAAGLAKTFVLIRVNLLVMSKNSPSYERILKNTLSRIAKIEEYSLQYSDVKNDPLCTNEFLILINPSSSVCDTLMPKSVNIISSEVLKLGLFNSPIFDVICSMMSCDKDIRLPCSSNMFLMACLIFFNWPS